MDWLVRGVPFPATCLVGAQPQKGWCVMSVKAEIKGGNLILTIPMNPKPTPSTSGKTLVVASTHGNQPTEVKVDGQLVTVGVNAYIKPPRA